MTQETWMTIANSYPTRTRGIIVNYKQTETVSRDTASLK